MVAQEAMGAPLRLDMTARPAMATQTAGRQAMGPQDLQGIQRARQATALVRNHQATALALRHLATVARPDTRCP